MRGTTSNEFLDWREVLHTFEWERTRVLHYYLAQIALEVAKGHTEDPEDLTLDHFLLRFELAAKKEEAAPAPTQEVIDARVARSKAAWCGMVGVQPPPQAGQKDALDGSPRPPNTPGGVKGPPGSTKRRRAG